MKEKTPITVAHGDGIGPEIMDATLKILEAAKASLDIETIEIGEKVYLSGVSSGISPASWDSLRRTKVFLKAPITTPQGGGVKSLNVTVRKSLGLYANVRPCVSYSPFIETKHPKMNVVIIRENEEDLYAGIEHRQTPGMYQCLKLISRDGCERIIRYAFEYAKQNNRKKVSCLTKDNIMKMTDGIFHQTFDEIAKEYPEIQNEHWIIDIGTARLADTPEEFDVIVTLNLYGDIISDVAAQITGSVGLGGSANIGDDFAMFEAIHGSAPTIAGKNMANPSGLILASIMMLVHIGQPKAAQLIHNAWLATIEDGIHTADIYSTKLSKKQVGTSEFTSALLGRITQSPEHFSPVSYLEEKRATIVSRKKEPENRTKKELVGVDLFLCAPANCDINLLGNTLRSTDSEKLKLSIITNKGLKVWPDPLPGLTCSDHWRCRFKATGEAIDPVEIVKLLDRVHQKGLEFIKIENLYTFDGSLGYSLGQGE